MMKEEYYWWEIQIFMRKALIIFATEYLACVSKEVQCLVGIVIIIANIVLLLNLLPYAARNNELSVGTQVTQMITMYFGILYISNVRPWYLEYLGTDIVVIILIILPPLIIMLYIFYKILIIVLILIYRHNKKVFRVITCGCVNDDAFENKYMRQKKFEAAQECCDHSREEVRADHSTLQSDGQYPMKGTFIEQ